MIVCNVYDVLLNFCLDNLWCDERWSQINNEIRLIRAFTSPIWICICVLYMYCMVLCSFVWFLFFSFFFLILYSVCSTKKMHHHHRKWEQTKQSFNIWYWKYHLRCFAFNLLLLHRGKPPPFTNSQSNSELKHLRGRQTFSTFPLHTYNIHFTQSDSRRSINV